jgi:hypothetical protein
MASACEAVSLASIRAGNCEVRGLGEGCGVNVPPPCDAIPPGPGIAECLPHGGAGLGGEDGFLRVADAADALD